MQLDKSVCAILIEKDPVVAALWSMLLRCTEADILNYPVPRIWDKTSDFFIMTCAVSNAVSKCSNLTYTPRVARVFDIQRRRIVARLPLRDRIDFVQGDYSTAPNIRGTWFIDPPYTKGVFNPNNIFPAGNGYSRSCNSDSIDYAALAEWAISRCGQVIVCEKLGASWLPFTPLHSNKTSLNKVYKEVVYYGSN